MGTTINYQTVGEAKLNDLKKRQQTMKEGLAARELPDLKGPQLAVADDVLSVNDLDTKGSVMEGIVQFCSAQAAGGWSSVFQVMAEELKGFVKIAKSSGILMETFRAYPLAVNQGLGMLYANVYLEKGQVHKNGQLFEQVILVYAMEIVKPPNPKDRAEVASLVAFSNLKEPKDRQEAVNSIWRIIMGSWDKETLKAEIDRLTELKKAYDLMKEMGM